MQGQESPERFAIILGFTKITSENVKAALYDYLVVGFNDTAAATLNFIPVSNFNRALKIINEVACEVEKLKVMDWAHLNQSSDKI